MKKAVQSKGVDTTKSTVGSSVGVQMKHFLLENESGFFFYPFLGQSPFEASQQNQKITIEHNHSD
jgi:hypothetical protein